MNEVSPAPAVEASVAHRRYPRQVAPLLVLACCVYLGWALWALLVRSHFASTPRQELWAGIAARLLFWVLPCGIYLAKVCGERPLSPLGLGFPLGAAQIRRTIVLSVVTTWALFLATAARHGSSFQVEVSRFIRLAELRLVAPVIEELVFRGVFLSELLEWTHSKSRTAGGLRVRYWLAQLGCAVFFVLLHWPSWWPYLTLPEMLERSVPVLAIALMLGFVFAHTRSIWPCIWLHWLNNELSLMA